MTKHGRAGNRKAETDLQRDPSDCGHGKIYLFGSYAYGAPTQNSDFDLCVIIPDNDLRPTDAIKKIRRALYPVQDMPLDIIVYRSEDFTNRQQTASLERKISREGVLLYA